MKYQLVITNKEREATKGSKGWLKIFELWNNAKAGGYKNSMSRFIKENKL